MNQGIKYSKDKLPIATVIFKQFPNAIEEITRCSKAGHDKYNKNFEDQDWQNFSRVPNAKEQYLNAALRHLKDSETKVFNEDMTEYDPKVRHLAQFVWNGLAALEVEMRIQQEEKLDGVWKVHLKEGKLYDEECKSEEKIPKYMIKNWQEYNSNWDRPTLSVDKLLNRDDYPDFPVDHEVG